MGNVQRASIITKDCPMFDPACAERVIAHVQSLMVGGGLDGGLEKAQTLVEAQCGRYTRGTHKGALRGWASISIVDEGGWYRGDGGSGRVVYPGTLMGVTVADRFSGKTYLTL